MVSQMTRRVLSEMFGGVGVTTVCGQTDCSAHSLFFLLLCSPCQLCNFAAVASKGSSEKNSHYSPGQMVNS